MNEQALYCDGTVWYVNPAEPECNQEVTIRFRAAKDDDIKVNLIVEEKAYEMKKESTKGAFDYYSIQWQLGEKPIQYYFEIEDEEKAVCYLRNGVHRGAHENYMFTIVPGFSTPDWAKGAVMYQIFTDRFNNGDKTNDVETREHFYIKNYSNKVEDWEKTPEAMDVHNFYGGDIQGIIDKLDYLQDLGVEVLYLNPVFVSPSNHKYDTQDYDHVDPHYGVILEDDDTLLEEGVKDNSKAKKYQTRTTSLKNLEASDKLFVKLVEEVHKRHMRIILDGVFNHCGSFNKWMDRERIYESSEENYAPGAYISADSPYHDYFLFKDNKESSWPYNEDYDGWWGHETLPKLNHEGSEKLEEYLFHIGEKWVSPPYNIDGWRLDVAADLGVTPEFNHKFWKKFRNVVKEANPEAIILAEHYGSPRAWLQGDEWDTIMNYDAFMEPVTWFLTGMQKHSDAYKPEQLGNARAFVGSMEKYMSEMLTPSLQTAMNELSNHDHSRFLTRTNRTVGRLASKGAKAAEEGVDKAVFREAITMQMTWIGAPTIYYGDEAGVCGWTDPDNRRTYPWGKEDKELLAFYREMTHIHRREPALKKGSLKFLTARQNILAYGRFTDDSQIIVVLNNSDELKQVTIPTWLAEVPENGVLRRLIYTYKNGYTTDYEEYFAHDGELVLNLGAKSALVLKNLDIHSEKAE